MAGIDKIYGDTKQYDILKAWLEENKPEGLNFLYPRDGYTSDYDRPISCFPEWLDMWLLKNCPLDFVVARIKDQYNIKERHMRPKTVKRSGVRR